MYFSSLDVDVMLRRLRNEVDERNEEILGALMFSCGARGPEEVQCSAVQCSTVQCSAVPTEQLHTYPLHTYVYTCIS